MSTTANRHPDDPGWYEIRLRGHLDQRWTTRFDQMSLTACRDGTTLLRGSVADQSALHGLLHKLRDTGLPLVSVNQVEPDSGEHAPTSLADRSPIAPPGA